MKRLLEGLVVIAGFGILMLIGFAQQAGQKQEQPSVYSSYDTGPNGYEALYDVLWQERVPVERVEQELGLMQNTGVTGLPPVGTLVIAPNASNLAYQTALNPSFDRGDLQQLKIDIQHGLRVIVLDTGGLREFASAMPSVFSKDGQRITRRNLVPARVTLTIYRLGKGSLTVVGVPEIFSNKNIALGNNARFAYDLVSGNGAVGFYERIHGYVSEKSFWSALPPAVHTAIWIVAAIVVLGLIGANIRFAPPIAVDPPDERDSSAYLSGMSSLLRRARASRQIARVPSLENSIELSWVLAGTPPGDTALVRAAVLSTRSRKERA